MKKLSTLLGAAALALGLSAAKPADASDYGPTTSEVKEELADTNRSLSWGGGLGGSFDGNVEGLIELGFDGSIGPYLDFLSPDSEFFEKRILLIGDLLIAPGSVELYEADFNTMWDIRRNINWSWKKDEYNTLEEISAEQVNIALGFGIEFSHLLHKNDFQQSYFALGPRLYIGRRSCSTDDTHLAEVVQTFGLDLGVLREEIEDQGYTGKRLGASFELTTEFNFALPKGWYIGSEISLDLMLGQRNSTMNNPLARSDKELGIYATFSPDNRPYNIKFGPKIFDYHTGKKSFDDKSGIVFIIGGEIF